MAKNILVGLDFSPISDKVLDEVKTMAAASSGKIWLVHVAEPAPDFIGYEVDPRVLRTPLAEKFRDEHRRLQQQAQKLRDAGIDATALLIQGPVPETLLHEAEKLAADMIVVGSHGYGAMHQLLVGSVSESVLRKAICPVLIVPVREGAEP